MYYTKRFLKYTFKLAIAGTIMINAASDWQHIYLLVKDSHYQFVKQVEKDFKNSNIHPSLFYFLLTSGFFIAGYAFYGLLDRDRF